MIPTSRDTCPRALRPFIRLLALPLVLVACSGEGLTETSSSAMAFAKGGIPGRPRPRIPKGEAQIIKLTVSPDPATVAPLAKHAFVAMGSMADGTERKVSATWKATGGTITETGEYTAGPKLGSYHIMAIHTQANLSDTARVEIAAVPDDGAPTDSTPEPPPPDSTPEPPPPSAPTLIAVVLTPATVSLTAATTQQFTAVGQLSDGTSGPVNVTYSATGGTITQAGLYTAGSSAGTFRAMATAGNGRADTAAITVTALTPPPPPSAGCSGGIAVAVGASLQSAIDANPSGATFCLKAGTHKRLSVTAKTGQTFVCEAGAVLDGENVAGVAFKSSGGNPDRVTIKGCHLTRYNPGAQAGVVMAGGHNPADRTDGWLLEDVEISYSNSGTGLVLGDHLVCRRCNLHHNDVQNVAGQGRGILIEDSELAYGNYRKLNDWGFSGGGSKFVLTDSLVVRRTYAHHNHGPGLWTDIDNIHVTYENNRIEDNAGPGIYHEISYSARICGNTIKRNGFGFTGWVWGAGIQISASGGSGNEQIEICNNVLEGNRMDIMAAQQNRGSGAYGPHDVRNLWVHDNTILSRNGAQSGAAQDNGADLSTRNIRFDRNTYRANHPRPFGWANGARTWTDWRGFGHDQAGSYAAE